MVSTGLSLAVLTGIGFYMIYYKLPARIKKFMQKHMLFTDVISCLLTYLLFGGTLVALFAAAWMGLIVSIMLAITSNPVTNDILERFTAQTIQLKDKFVEWVAKQNINTPITEE